MTVPPPIRTISDVWVAVMCCECGRYLCSVKAGGTVKITCRKCKITIIKAA